MMRRAAVSRTRTVFLEEERNFDTRLALQDLVSWPTLGRLLVILVWYCLHVILGKESSGTQKTA
jgi:hypothetical protein